MYTHEKKMSSVVVAELREKRQQHPPDRGEGIPHLRLGRFPLRGAILAVAVTARMVVMTWSLGIILHRVHGDISEAREGMVSIHFNIREETAHTRTSRRRTGATCPSTTPPIPGCRHPTGI